MHTKSPKEVVHFHLGNHGCLNLDDPSTQMLGGPTRSEGGNECEWFAVTPHLKPRPIAKQLYGFRRRSGLWERELGFGRQ